MTITVGRGGRMEWAGDAGWQIALPPGQDLMEFLRTMQVDMGVSPRDAAAGAREIMDEGVVVEFLLEHAHQGGGR